MLQDAVTKVLVASHDPLGHLLGKRSLACWGVHGCEALGMRQESPSGVEPRVLTSQGCCTQSGPGQGLVSCALVAARTAGWAGAVWPVNADTGS